MIVIMVVIPTIVLSVHPLPYRIQCALYCDKLHDACQRVGPSSRYAYYSGIYRENIQRTLLLLSQSGGVEDLLLGIYSTSQKFGHTFNFFEKCFLYFYYFLHRRFILKTFKLRKNTYGMMY